MLKVFTALPGPDSSIPRPLRETTSYPKRGMDASRKFKTKYKSMIIDNWAGKFRGILEIRGFE
jgi:hypothetical protein